MVGEIYLRPIITSALVKPSCHHAACRDASDTGMGSGREGPEVNSGGKGVNDTDRFGKELHRKRTDPMRERNG